MRGDGGDRRAVTGDGTMCTEGGGLPVVCWSDLYLRCVCFAVSWFLNMGEFWDYLRHVLSRYFHTAQCTLDLDLDMWILIVQTSMILNMNILECSPVTMFKCV